MDHLKEFGALVVKAVKDHVSKALAPLAEQVAALQQWRESVPIDLKGEPGRDGKDGRDGVDGKDADPAAMRAAIAAAVAEVPPATNGRDGKDGTSVDPEEVRTMVRAAVAEIPLPRDGVDGRDGKDVDQDAVKALVQQAVDALPRPRDGIDGKDGVNGKDIDPAAVKDLAAEVVAVMLPAAVAKGVAEALPAAVADAVASLPRPADGKDGRDGVDGKGVDMLTLEATIRGLVTEGVAAIPQPKDGRDGRDAIEIDVRRGLDPARRYQPGEHVAYRGGVIRSYRQTDAMPDGAQLEDHGWHVVQNGIDELAADWADDGRTVAIAIRMTDGTTTVKQLAVPLAIDRGVYDEAAVYQRGDGVTWDGSWWIAQRGAAAAEKPGASDAWRLAVRKGRNGRDGLKGDPGQRGAPGRDGIDKKW